MKWEHRKPLIMQHITSLDPDVMGLCDLDIGLIRAEVEDLGYRV